MSTSCSPLDLRRLEEAQRRCPDGLRRLAAFVGAVNAEPFTVLKACYKQPAAVAAVRVRDTRASVRGSKA